MAVNKEMKDKTDRKLYRGVISMVKLLEGCNIRDYVEFYRQEEQGNSRESPGICRNL